VVEGTKIKGNIEDMRDIFMSICSAMKETKDYCRINVNSKIWRYDDMLWDQDKLEFIKLNEEISTLTVIIISLAIVITILILLGLL